MGTGAGVRLRSLEGETFRFDPGAFCLEFALTGGEGYRAAYETLHSAADLGRWIKGSLGVEVEQVTGRDLARAKRLRQAIWECADARIEGRSLPQGAVTELNRCAARPPLAPEIDPTAGRKWAEPVTTSRVLSGVARDAVDLYAGPRGGRIRSCEGTNCPLIFVDTSRPGRRRWCSMERCGNRHKVTAFRSRRRKGEGKE